MSIAQPRKSILTLFDPLSQQDASPPKQSTFLEASLEPNKENATPPHQGPKDSCITLAAYFNRTYQKHQSATPTVKKRLVDVGDVTVDEASVTGTVDVIRVARTDQQLDTRVFVEGIEDDIIATEPVPQEATSNAAGPRPNDSALLPCLPPSPHIPGGDQAPGPDIIPVVRRRYYRFDHTLTQAESTSNRSGLGEEDIVPGESENPRASATRSVSPRIIVSAPEASPSFPSVSSDTLVPSLTEPHKRPDSLSMSIANSRRFSVDLQQSFGFQMRCLDSSFDLLNDKVSFFDNGGHIDSLNVWDEEESFELKVEGDRLHEPLKNLSNKENPLIVVSPLSADGTRDSLSSFPSPAKSMLQLSGPPSSESDPDPIFTSPSQSLELTSKKSSLVAPQTLKHTIIASKSSSGRRTSNSPPSCSASTVTSDTSPDNVRHTGMPVFVPPDHRPNILMEKVDFRQITTPRTIKVNSNPPQVPALRIVKRSKFPVAAVASSNSSTSTSGSPATIPTTLGLKPKSSLSLTAGVPPASDKLTTATRARRGPRLPVIDGDIDGVAMQAPTEMQNAARQPATNTPPIIIGMPARRVPLVQDTTASTSSVARTGQLVPTLSRTNNAGKAAVGTSLLPRKKSKVGATLGGKPLSNSRHGVRQTVINGIIPSVKTMGMVSAGVGMSALPQPIASASSATTTGSKLPVTSRFGAKTVGFTAPLRNVT